MVSQGVHVSRVRGFVRGSHRRRCETRAVPCSPRPARRARHGLILIVRLRIFGVWLGCLCPAVMLVGLRVSDSVI